MEILIFFWFGIIHYTIPKNSISDQIGIIISNIAHKFGTSTTRFILHILVVFEIVWRYYLICNYCYLYDNAAISIIITSSISLTSHLIYHNTKIINDSWYFGIILYNNIAEVLFAAYLITNNNNFISWISTIYVYAVFLSLILFVYLVITHWQKYDNERIKRSIHFQYEIVSTKDKPLDDICIFCHCEYGPDENYFVPKCKHLAHSLCFEEYWDKTGKKKCYYQFCGKPN